jgi:hypothetical protein
LSCWPGYNCYAIAAAMRTYATKEVIGQVD